MSNVSKKIFTLIFLILGIALVIFSMRDGDKSQFEQFQQIEQFEHIVTIGGQEVMVELADTLVKRAQGLSGREPLADNQGMLFVFPQAGRNSFWMKDMKFPLDIIWINDGKIVDIWANAPTPKPGQAIPSHRPQAEATHVLEVNAGFTDKYGIKIGDLVDIDISGPR